MKIKSFNFKNNNQSWYIDDIYFDNLNLLVGASGVGKTRILRALDLICDVAKDTEHKLDNMEWSIDFSHLDGEYRWQIKTSGLINEPFSSEPGRAEILYEELTEFRDHEVKTIFKRDRKQSFLNDVELPKLKKTESAITLLAEEDSVAPVAQAFKRFIFNEIPQRAFLSIAFDPDNVSILAEEKLENNQSNLSKLETFKESAVDTPTVFKAYLIQKFFPNIFGEIKESYVEIFPNVEDIKISINKELGNDYQLIFEIKENGVNDWIPQHRMSSGMYRTLTCLVEVIAAPDGSIIIIDEFENSLGINCMPDLTDFILEKSPELQFILTSHHPYIINNIPWKTWQVVSRSGSIIKSTKAEDIPALDTASSLDKFTQLINLLECED